MVTLKSIEIDAADYAVLEGVYRNGKSWKKRVHQWITENIDSLPLDEPKSIQTTGRRVDRLQDAGLLEARIMSPEAVNREMIIGYTLTSDGEQVLKTQRNMLLHDMVQDASWELITAGDYGATENPVDRGVLVRLMTAVYDIDAETREDVLPQIATDELLGLLAAHFFLDNADDTFNPEHEDAMAAFLEQTPQFRRPFEKKTLIARLRERISGRPDGR